MMQSLAELSLKISGSQNINPTSPATLHRVSRIESVLDDYKGLMGHRRISSLDKQRLSDAAELWHDVDKRLQSATQACALDLPASSAENWGARHQLALDTVATALACGMSRNVAYGLIQGGDNMNDQLTMHGWEHDPRLPNEGSPSLADAFYSQLLPWRSKVVTSFLRKLDSLTDENGQSLLDSSLVVWGHQYSDHGHAMLVTPWSRWAAQTASSIRLARRRGGRTGQQVPPDQHDGHGPQPRRHRKERRPRIRRSRDAHPNRRQQQCDHRGRARRSARPEMGSYDTTKKDHFAADAERRKPFAYLKS